MNAESTFLKANILNQELKVYLPPKHQGTKFHKVKMYSNIIFVNTFVFLFLSGCFSVCYFSILDLD